jgi:putative membrane protein
MRPSKFFFILPAIILLFALPKSGAFGADEPSAKRAAASQLAKPEEEFIHQAAQGGMMKARLGEIAAEKASARPIKEIGASIVKEHNKANQELQTLATKRGVVLEKDLNAKHRETVDRVAKLTGEEFDKAFASEMISSHKKGVSAFGKAGASAKDADLKAFIEKTLAVLKLHLQKLEALEIGSKR